MGNYFEGCGGLLAYNGVAYRGEKKFNVVVAL